jgi:hypothetical protein
MLVNLEHFNLEGSERLGSVTAGVEHTQAESGHNHFAVLGCVSVSERSHASAHSRMLAHLHLKTPTTESMSVT